MPRPFLCLLATILALPAWAEGPYRLVVGDLLIVDYDFLEEPKQSVVDIDGNVRLAELDSIEAAGKTLDEVEMAIALGMAEGGFSGVSFVSVELAAYAPIVVSGYVERAGQYDYLPGMTVGAAVALAGGLGDDGSDGGNVAVQRAAAARRAAEASDRIVETVAAITALRAALAGDEADMQVDPALRDVVVPSRQGELDAVLGRQRDQLAVERDRTRALLASWAAEIEDFTAQIALLDDRIAVKGETLEVLGAELADLEQLRERGLATTSRLSTLQQRLADDREELLALEVAKVSVGRTRALAERNRTDFVTTQARDRIVALREAETGLAAARRDRDAAIEELAGLGGADVADPTFADLMEVRYAVEGPRAARFDGAGIDRSTPLLPGDILVVDAVLRLPGEDG